MGNREGGGLRVGRIVRPHGLNGAVVVAPETDFGETRFRRGAAVWVTPVTGEPVRAVVAVSRPYADRWVVQFDGRASVEDAEAWRGALVSVEAGDLAPLPEGQYYLHDLVGCAVETADGEAVGQVETVYSGGAQQVLGIRSGAGEVLVPLVPAICREVDVAAKRIVIAPPAGLLDVNR